MLAVLPDHTFHAVQNRPIILASAARLHLNNNALLRPPSIRAVEPSRSPPFPEHDWERYRRSRTLDQESSSLQVCCDYRQHLVSFKRRGAPLLGGDHAHGLGEDSYRFDNRSWGSLGD